MNNIKIWVGSALGAVGTLLGSAYAHAAAISTSTLGSSIDDVSSTWYDYFTVFLSHAWPYIVGAVILVGMVIFGKRIIHALFG